MKKIIITMIIALGLLGCKQNTPKPNTTQSTTSQKSITGHWYFDLKASQAHAKTKEEKYLLKSLVGEEARFDNGTMYDANKKVGTYKVTSTNHYAISTKRGKTMQAIYKTPYLIITEKSNMGEFTLYFSQKRAKNTKGITQYIHLNRIYRQENKVYDNGYLYYLFMDNGVMYSHVSHAKALRKNEIMQKGTQLKYKYLNNKIYIRAAMFTITLNASNKTKLSTSQGDKLVLQ